MARTRVETGHTRALTTVFGEVSVTRLAYRAPGRANLHPADAGLNLPVDKHSHGLRRLAAIEASRILRRPQQRCATGGPSQPASSKAPAATLSKTASTSPEPGGDCPAPKPSSNSVPYTATATSTATGDTTSTANTAASTERATSTPKSQRPHERHSRKAAPKSNTGCSPRSAVNWRGRPLESHEVVIETLRATTTSTGLTVNAVLDTTTYDRGIKITDKQIAALEATQLHCHEFHGDWNYTLCATRRDEIERG